MKNVIILGASGNIAKHVIDILIKKDDINLSLFLRNKNRLRNKDVSKCRITPIGNSYPSFIHLFPQFGQFG
jgi:saccharopine dehydrogenase-like NADP-dependent oxidoreductase